MTRDGPVYKWNGTAWTAEQTGVQRGLLGVWGLDANHLWLVGETGAILGRP